MLPEGEVSGICEMEGSDEDNGEGEDDVVSLGTELGNALGVEL